MCVNEFWIQCRSGNWTSPLLPRWRRFSFVYPSKKSFPKFDILLSANNKVTRQHFNAQSSGGDCSIFPSKLRVDMLRRLQKAPASICSKPITESPRSCRKRIKDWNEIVIHHLKYTCSSSQINCITRTHAYAIYLLYIIMMKNSSNWFQISHLTM